VEQRIILRHLRDGEAKVDEFPVDTLIELTFGRDPSCQIHYGERDESVGRRHARLTVSRRDPLEITLSDLSSRNGTFVNGQRIQGEVHLKPGDRVQIGTGGPQFQFEVSGAAETRFVPLETPSTKAVETRNVIEVKQPLPPPPPPPLPSLQPLPSLLPARAASSQQSTTQRALLIVGIGLVVLGAVALIGYAATRGRGVLSYKVFHQRTIMSCAYKAYGNPDAEGGRYWFARTVLQNTGKGSVKNVKVSYQIPGYLTWTTPDEAPELLPNQTAVFVYYPKLPSKVSELRTRTPAVLETKVEYDDGSGVQSHTEKREFEFFGVTEFSYTSMQASEMVTYFDHWDNDPLLASYITDEDQAVKTFYAKIAEVSGGMGTGKDQKELEQFIKSTYNYMVSLGMTYSGAKGVPDSTGDVHSLVQSIRMPRDLIYGNTGLCIELAQLWCALGQAAGLKTYLVLIPTHAFPVLEAGDGTRIAVESTAIGGSFGGNLGKADTWEQAIELGVNKFKEQVSRPTTEILDIADLQSRGIRPPELPEINRPELVKLLDDRRGRRRVTNVTNIIVVRPVRPVYCPVCRPPWRRR